MTQEEREKIFGPFPDHPTTGPIIFQILDDEAIKRIIVESGRANCLNDRAELSGPMRLRMYYGDAKFFYLITRYYGYPNPIDNGYAAHLIHRETCSIDDAIKILRKIALDGDSGPALIDRIEFVNSGTN